MIPLSDAIGLGRVLAKPWTRGDHTGGCALQIAFLARDGKSEIPLDNEGWKNWDWAWKCSWETGRKVLPCACQGELMGGGLTHYGQTRKSFEEGSWSSVIIHMFNYHVVTVEDWTLDQLIDWVRSIEPREQQAQESLTQELVTAAVPS